MARDHLPENLWTVAHLDPQPTDHILELGFGLGVAIHRLSKIVTEGAIAGIDYSRTMVKAARMRNAAAVRAGRVDLRHGDAAELPLNDASFDKAYSIHAIYFWPKPLAVLTEVQRVLKKGGLLVITVLPREKWPPNPPGSLPEVGTPQCIPYSGDTISQMMTTAGFSCTSIESDLDAEHASNFSVIGVK